MTPTPVLRGQTEGDTVRNPLGGSLTFKVTADESGGALTVFESIAAAGEGPPLHVHPSHDEVLHILEGAFRFRVGDSVDDVDAGAVVFVPRGVPHTWQNVGGAPGRLTVVFAPGAAGMEGFFRAADAARGGEPRPDVFGQVGSGGEMEIVGPPLPPRDSSATRAR